MLKSPTISTLSVLRTKFDKNSEKSGKIGHTGQEDGILQQIKLAVKFSRLDEKD